jgi:hypothetical protein
VLRWKVISLAAMASLLPSAAVAAADPGAPQAGTPCQADLTDAMTVPPETAAPIICTGIQWEPVGTPYPISDRWLSYGPAITLHGEGRRNPNLLSGAWTATPRTGDTTCRAEQYAVIPGTPQVGPATVDRASPGHPVSFEVVPRLFSIELSGDCLWQRTGT